MINSLPGTLNSKSFGAIYKSFSPFCFHNFNIYPLALILKWKHPTFLISSSPISCSTLRKSTFSQITLSFFQKTNTIDSCSREKILNIRKSHSLAAEKANKILVQEKRPRGAAGIGQQRTTRSLRVCAHSFMRE